MTVVEACVDSVESARWALEGGSHRLELCERLDVGGTTPSPSLVATVREAAGLPIAAMIRPRGGSFVHTDAEVERMLHDIRLLAPLGVDALVFGVLTDAREVDVEAMRRLVDAAGPIPVVFHRAFDAIADQNRALDQLIELGVARVLTSGGAATALAGAAALSRLVAHAAGRITVMAGGKVRGENVRTLVRETGVTDVHARCDSAEVIPAIARALYLANP